MENNEIKALTPCDCPHCGKQIVIEFATLAPKLVDIFTTETIEEAKKETISRIEALGVDESISRPMIEWLRNPETLFGPDDIEEIIKQIKQQNDSIEGSTTP